MTDIARSLFDADQAAARGDLFTARQLLLAVIKVAPSVDLYLRLAGLSRALNQPGEALNQVDCVLEMDPLHFVALLMRASVLEQLGSTNAGEAYGRALAQRPPGALPQTLQDRLKHAEAVYAEFQVNTDRRVSLRIAALPDHLTEDEVGRVSRFRTNAIRLTKVFHSDPTHYHYPGLVEREFHDRHLFPWMGDLEAATDDIAREFGAVVQNERTEIAPYVQYPKGAPLRQWAALNQSRDWSAIHLLKNGMRVEANARHCPRTMEILQALPQPKIPGLSPNAMFSLLAPSAHIPPHTGVANTRLVCHLPLVVPQNCWFRVGAETRSWHRGQAWVFDDTIEHEAKNESEMLRVILIFDLWHPQLDKCEKAAIVETIKEMDHIDTSI